MPPRNRAVYFKKNPDKKIISISMPEGMFEKLQEHGLHISSFLEFQIRELKEKFDDGYSIPSEYFTTQRSGDRQKVPKTVYLDKKLLDWTGSLKRAVNGKERRFNRSRYLGEKLREIYYTLHYDISIGRLVSNIGKTLENLMCNQSGKFRTYSIKFIHKIYFYIHIRK